MYYDCGLKLAHIESPPFHIKNKFDLTPFDSHVRNGAIKHSLTPHNPIHTGPTHTQQQRLSLVNVSDTKKKERRPKDPLLVIKERTKKLNSPTHISPSQQQKYHTTKFWNWIISKTQKNVRCRLGTFSVRHKRPRLDMARLPRRRHRSSGRTLLHQTHRQRGKYYFFFFNLSRPLHETSLIFLFYFHMIEFQYDMQFVIYWYIWLFCRTIRNRKIRWCTRMEWPTCLYSTVTFTWCLPRGRIAMPRATCSFCIVLLMWVSQPRCVFYSILKRVVIPFAARKLCEF